MKHFILIFVLLFVLTATQASAHAESATATQAMVATVHPLATEAAVTAIKQGGNAIDGAIAAALTLGVVNGYNSGIGGGCFILIRLADGQVVAIDGREMAPQQSSRDMFLRAGRPHPELSTVGALAAGVPGALAAYAQAVKKHGRCSLEKLLLPAAKIASDGFVVDRDYARRLQTTAATLTRFAGSRAVLFKADGSPYQQGDILRQPDLATTYRAVARHGVAWFYQGPFAEKTERWMTQNGGIMTADDFAKYKVRRRIPIATDYRGYKIIGFPPPSSGGIHVSQILNILEHFDLRSLHRQDRATYVHVVSEAMKLAFADRAHWLGDADFSKVPRGLIDKKYAAQLARQIDMKQATAVPRHGTPPLWQSELFGKHTTHIAVADREGNWVALTTTVNTAFGSKVIIPGTGVVMNNQMDDFSIHPGVPNAFGLIGAEANTVAPGKRPLSSMSPTIVLKDGRPIMTVGAAGGPRIISQSLLTIVNYLDLEMSLEEAVAAPRFHHQWAPDRVTVESRLGEKLESSLKARGHQVQRLNYFGVTQAISISPDGKTLQGVSDPRVQGKAAGY